MQKKKIVPSVKIIKIIKFFKGNIKKNKINQFSFSSRKYQNL